MTHRLPIPGSDDGTWGNVLNDFLEVSINADGTLSQTAVSSAGAYSKPSSGIPAADLTSAVQADLSVASTAVQAVNNKSGTNITLVPSDIGAPTTLAALTDISGASSATNTQVLAFNGSTSKWTPSTVTSSTVSDATTGAKGILQLAGDLAGSATAPTVAKVNGVTLPSTAPTIGNVLTALSASTTSWTTPAAGVMLDSTAADIVAGTTTGSGVAGSVGKAADAGHQHPLIAHDHTTMNKGGQIPVTGLNVTGTASTSTFLRGDASWATVPASATNATTSAPGLVQLAGDLAGTATSPTVAKVNGITVTGTPSANQVLMASSTTAAEWAAITSNTQTLCINVKDFGATGDGSTDDTVAITSAIATANTAGGGIVFFPSGTYLTGQQTIFSNVLYAGTGPGASIIKLKNGSNTDLFLSYQFSTLTGGTSNGPSKFGFKDLTLDANRSNQTSTSLCARIYGYNYIVQNVWFIDGYGGGVYSEWGGTDNPMEALWDNFKIWNYGGRPGSTGLEWNGPHDSMISNGIIATLDSTIQSTDTTYGTTPINGSTLTLPAAGTSFTFATTAAASNGAYPAGGGSFVLPSTTGTFTWATVNYTSATSSGGVTTFTGCTSAQGGYAISASGGIVVPTYGYRGRNSLEGAGHGATGEMMTMVHIWGRNHIGIYTDSSMYFNNCESEGAFIANVVLDVSGCVWTGGTIYGTNGQSGQANETGLQVGQNRGVSRCIVIAFIYNVGAGPSGAPIKMTNTNGDNMIRVAGTTGANAFLSAPFYNAGGDWYEIVCHNTQSLSIYHVPYQPKFPFGAFIGNGTNLPSAGGHLYAGSGVPSITNSAAGDYYFRIDTPATTSQQIYVATGANTWTAITSGGGGGAAFTEGGAWAANTSYTQGQVVTSPNGDRITPLVAFTSGNTYNAGNWVTLAPQPTISSIPTLSSQLTTALNRGEAITTASFNGSLASAGTWNSNPINGLDPGVFGANPASYWAYQVQAGSSITAVMQVSSTGTSGWTAISSQTSVSLAGQQTINDRGIVPSNASYMQLVVTNGSTSQSVRANFKISGASYTA